MIASIKPKDHPIGVPGAPYPTMIRTEEKVGGKDVVSYKLGVIEDGKTTLRGTRSYAETMGTLIRGMPVRDMLPAFEKIVHHANPSQNNRLCYVSSDPGFGKSFVAVLVGKARDARGPIITDAGGKNLEYLLYRNVFDSEGSKQLTQKIDEALAEGTLNPLSIKALRKFGKHFSVNSGRQCIDWNGLTADEKLEKGEKQLTIEEIKSVLDTVKSVEGWEGKSLGIGFKVEKGPLVLANEQGRDLIIDEIDKCKEGSEGPLQQVWQVLNGEIAQHTVPLSSLGSYTFKRGAAGLVVFTGNNPKDGKASHLISESFDRRVPRFEIPNFSAGSWTDITASIISGLPIPLLHEISPGEWKSKDPKSPTESRWVIKDEEAFTQKLFEFTTLGMDDEDRRKIKEWQLSEVSNWKNVLEASIKLGAFYHKWAQLADPTSEIYEGGKFSDIQMEVDDPKKPTLKVTPSTMIRHIEEALIDGSVKKEAGKSGGFSKGFNWNEPVQHAAGKDPVEENIGTRLVQAILDEVHRTSMQTGKKKLYEQLMQDAKEAGLVGNPPAIAALLNVDPTKIKGSLGQVKQEQNIHAELLRTLFPKLGLSANDEDILPLRYVQSAIEHMEKNRQPVEVSAFTTALDVPNTDVNTATTRLYDRVAADNKDPSESLAEVQKRLPPSKLLDHLTLLSSLAMLSVGERNMDALWNKALTKGGFAADESMEMAQDQSKTGIGVTSVSCRKGEGKTAEYVTLHVIRNKTKGQTIIVGSDKIPDDLYNRLKKKNIDYINQEHFSAEDRLTSDLKEVVPAKHMDAVKAALLLRNKADKKDQDKELPALLADNKTLKLEDPNFVTTLVPESISHASRAVDQKLKKRLMSNILGG